MSPMTQRQWLRGLAAVAALILALPAAALAHLRIPTPGVELMVGVVYATFEGGLGVGLVAAVAGEVYLALDLASRGLLIPDFASATGSGTQLATFGASALAATVMVARLRHRSERRFRQEREHRERMADLERVKSQFLNVASHELRGPLAVARGYVAMLADGTFGPPAAADVRAVVPVVMTKLDEMNQLVDSMLDTARLEEHRLLLMREQLDVRDLVDRAVAAVQLMLTPRHHLNWRRPRQPVLVEADDARLSIIITNLIQNAIKYSPDGGLVEVFCAADNGRATVTVWDQGLGIAEKDMPRLFTRFGRIVTPGNSHILGTGLGLYLSRELARLHGGDLVVTSAAGRGSSFSLTLPLAEPAEESPPPPGETVAEPPPGRPADVAEAV